MKLAAILLFSSALVLSAQTDPGLREEGVLYLEADVPGKVTGKIHAPTTIYSQRNFQMALAVLPAGQEVQILGSADEGYLIKGSARNNTVTGWIHPSDLPDGFDTSIFAQARKIEERRAAIAIAIANKTVVRGMTPDEVEKALGHPTQTNSRTDAHGSGLTWIYTTYREEPQYSYAIDAFGRPVLQTYYVKIPIGRMTIVFNAGVVDSIDQHKTTSEDQ